MKSPIFNNVRWGELLGWLTGLSGILSALVMSPIPEHWKAWLQVAIAVVGFFLAFLRNPKSLDWVDEAQAAAVAIKHASDYERDRSDEQ